MNAARPAYLKLLETGKLQKRTEEAYRRLEHCELCAVRCRGQPACRKAGQLPDRREGAVEQLWATHG